MALLKCPDCNQNVSSFAENCPNCGYSFSLDNRPQNSDSSSEKKVCKYCHTNSLTYSNGVIGIKEASIFLFLFLFNWMIPGVIYYIWTESVPYCRNCRKRIFDKQNFRLVVATIVVSSLLLHSFANAAFR